MNATGKSFLSIFAGLVLAVIGVWLWSAHARAWGLGGWAPVLGYDAAQYAVAARELADHGRLATRYALPLELSRHATPPWPLALVQPGLVIGEAALFKAASLFGGSGAGASGAARLEWLALVIPATSYIGLALLVMFGVHALLSRDGSRHPELCLSAGILAGFTMLLDAEAQHFATGGFTELPFTLGLAAAVIAIATGAAGRRPFSFGLLLGVTGAFRGNMLWLAPLLAAGAAATASDRRITAWRRALAGFALPLLPWWIYKWMSFGSPAWDLSWVSIWTGIGGHDWFSLNHLPELPELPAGFAAFRLIASKTLANMVRLGLELSRGPGALLIGALAIWAIGLSPGDRASSEVPRRRVAPEIVAARTLLAVLLVTVIAAAMSVPLRRYLFPARILTEAAGLLALWGLFARAPRTLLGERTAQVLAALVTALVIGWGAWGTTRGWAEADVAGEGRGVPNAASMIRLAEELDRTALDHEPVMSNLGPILAWYSPRPVVHLALTPDDLETCRRRLDVRHVLLVFRGPDRAWPGWGPVIERPEEAVHRREWSIARARRSTTEDGFTVVWLELGPLEAKMAARE